MLAPPAGGLAALLELVPESFRQLLGVDELLVADVDGQWRWAFQRLTTLSLGPVLGELAAEAIDAQWSLVARWAIAWEA